MARAVRTDRPLHSALLGHSPPPTWPTQRTSARPYPARDEQQERVRRRTQHRRGAASAQQARHKSDRCCCSGQSHLDVPSTHVGAPVRARNDAAGCPSSGAVSGINRRARRARRKVVPRGEAPNDWVKSAVCAREHFTRPATRPSSTRSKMSVTAQKFPNREANWFSFEDLRDLRGRAGKS